MLLPISAIVSDIFLCNVKLQTSNFKH